MEKVKFERGTLGKSRGEFGFVRGGRTEEQDYDYSRAGVQERAL